MRKKIKSGPTQIVLMRGSIGRKALASQDVEKSLVHWLLPLTPQTLVPKFAQRKQLSNHVYSYGVQKTF